MIIAIVLGVLGVGFIAREILRANRRLDQMFAELEAREKKLQK